MRKFLNSYINLIGYSILGLVFGLAFFILFVNFYHYKGTSSVYKKQSGDFKINDEVYHKISLIKENINSFDSSKYQGGQNVNSLGSIKLRLNTCILNIDTKEFNDILNKKEININDIYKMQQFYQTNISNECLVKQLYEISEDNKLIMLGVDQKTIKILIKSNIEDLIMSTDYLQKVLKNNSCYYLDGFSGKNDIFDRTKDSYYELIRQYRNSLDFIYNISIWFREVSK